MSVYADRPWLKLYPDHVPHELALPQESMVDLFEASARRAPERDAIRYFDEAISFARLDDLSSRFAAALAERDVRKGDRIAVFTQNDPQFLVAQYGAWKRGAIVVPLNPMFKHRELDYHLNDSGARVLVCLESLYHEVAREVLPGTGVEHVFTTSELDFLPEGADHPPLAGARKLATEGTGDLLGVLEATAPDDGAREPVSPEDIAYLVYTSGTTGPPKGAVETHSNVAYNAEVYRTWMRMGEEDSVFGVAPLFHITGLVGHIALAGLAGIPLVLFHRFDPGEALRLIEKWRPTMTVGSITVFIALMNAPGAAGRDLSSLKKCYSGGAPIAPSITEQFEEKFGVYIHNIYGLTESNSPTHAVPYGSRAPVDEKSGALSVGVPVPGCAAQLVSLEDPSQEVPPGEQGEFAAKGPMIFREYWNKPEETERAFHDGYFLTGDVAVMDEEGWFYIVDRKKDMINAGGYKVWPREVEDVLYTHPAVKEAAVVGAPDPYRGETVVAFVALKEDQRVSEEELISYCKERMAAYKYPRRIEFLEEVPKTATGKFLRRELRSRAQSNPQRTT
ncbi:long-chain-fatty-acid--CoA ligase [Rubrobacter xylanophilus]|uniref:Long-chain-fatty-acid--CoA ligase n=1 Tax=Rubrobacter xylanophilus TaxID=49319 RepID=A0A510HIH0_9ACTN|nr:long-chain fatty acid--CoA ligase [Rubrobacter xylanophilus]BBL79734.1 long-chain-fatty-acid--CoA ligase [Rubrobacter xylanophilus]